MKIVKQREQIVYEEFSTTRRGLRIVFSCIDSWQAGAASLGLNVCRTNKKGPLKVTRWNVGGMEVSISLWSNTKENFLFVFARFSLRHQTYSFLLIYFMLLNPFRSGVFHFYFYFSSPQPTYFFSLMTFYEPHLALSNTKSGIWFPLKMIFNWNFLCRMVSFRYRQVRLLVESTSSWIFHAYVFISPAENHVRPCDAYNERSMTFHLAGCANIPILSAAQPYVRHLATDVKIFRKLAV